MRKKITLFFIGYALLFSTAVAHANTDSFKCHKDKLPNIIYSPESLKNFIEEYDPTGSIREMTLNYGGTLYFNPHVTEEGNFYGEETIKIGIIVVRKKLPVTGSVNISPKTCEIISFSIHSPELNYLK
ncbi:MAG: hypothetical protein HOO06_04675 [Bdellovibrionaceae bacterium]|jgi:hypothetical protein|nr:hypothetical protein [Pseudobdellovibrionaceae bacterium]